MKQTAQEIDKHIREAARKLVVAVLEYRSPDLDPDEESKIYKVEPYSYRDSGKKFFGFDRDAKSIKAFSVSGIVNVSLTDIVYKPRWTVELK